MILIFELYNILLPPATGFLHGCATLILLRRLHTLSSHTIKCFRLQSIFHVHLYISLVSSEVRSTVMSLPQHKPESVVVMACSMYITAYMHVWFTFHLICLFVSLRTLWRISQAILSVCPWRSSTARGSDTRFETHAYSNNAGEMLTNLHVINATVFVCGFFLGNGLFSGVHKEETRTRDDSLAGFWERFGKLIIFW